MAARLPLPKHESLPAMVVFHRDHPRDPVITLQIPNGDRTDSETYILRTDRPDDMEWLDKLVGAQALRDKLTMEQHVAFDTQSGFMRALADLDTPGPMAAMVRDAQAQARNSSFAAGLRSAVRRGPNIPISPLRQALSRGRQR